MQFTALQSTGMHTAIPSSGAGAVGIGLAARPALPSCREPHDLPDAPLSGLPSASCHDLVQIGFSQDLITPPSGHHLPAAQMAPAAGQVRRLALSRGLALASLAVPAQECRAAVYREREYLTLRTPQAESASVTCIFQRTYSGKDSYRSHEQHEFAQQHFHGVLAVAH
jgi:hypothetical protein